MKRKFQLLRILAASAITLSVSTHVLAAPKVVAVKPSLGYISYTSIGASQVEYAWPASGVVCRHNTPAYKTKVLKCNGLQRGRNYKIVDFYDGRQTRVYYPEVSANYYCERHNRNGNLKALSYGLSRDGVLYIEPDVRIRPTWLQIQRETNKGPVTVAQGTNAKAYNLQLGETYTVVDLTYGGRITLTLQLRRDECQRR